MKGPTKEPATPPERDERLYDEKVRLIRPGRLIAGFAMIGIAIIWLVVENVLGSSSRQPAPVPTIVAGPRIPSISTAQPFLGGIVDVAVQARPDRVNGHATSAGTSFLVPAIQIMNRSSTPLKVAPTDFTLLEGTHRIGFGAALPGHDALFAPTGIPPGKTEEGDLVFSVPNAASSLVLVYAPRERRAAPLKWSVPAAGT
jgi:uncharacterized protein DUF4352